MKVSVIVPAYNEAAFIGRTLVALKAQTYPDVEVIVVDNNSSDATSDEVRTFPWVRLLQEPRPGVQFAREKGRGSATGELIANLDADCQPGPHWIEKAVAHFSNPRVSGISGPYQHTDAPWLFRIVSFLTQNIFFWAVSNFANALFHRGVIAMGGNLFARANALAAIGGYDTSIKFHGDDLDTSNRLAGVGSFLYCNDIIVGSSSRRYWSTGLLRLQWRYVASYFSVVFFHRPYTNTVTGR